MKVPISQIRPNPFQVRKHVDPERVQALADEIKAVGFWGGLRARKNGSHYELCFGHRRLEALRLLKIKEVELELSNWSDDEMATQALAENLQREGLTDLEKAEAIRQLVERFEQDGQGSVQARITKLMGLGKRRIDELLTVLELPRPLQKLVDRGEMSAKTAMRARQLGGDAMIETAAQHKLGLHTLTEMNTELAAIEDPGIREKVKKAVIAGKVRDADGVRVRERQVRIAQEGTPPKDLRLIIRSWTSTMKEWSDQLDQASHHLDYIDTDPEGAERFQAAARELIDRLKRFLPVIRGQK